MFSSAATNDANTFAAGTVTLGDDDGGAAMLALTNAKPDDADTSCIRVAYSGSLASSVRLYGTTTGTGLDAYLTLTVTRGIGPVSTFGDCAQFSPDATDYLGAGNGVIYSGTLQAFPDDYAAGLVDPLAASPETWTAGEVHVYKFVATLANDDAAQGKNATQTLIWEARNL